MDKLKKQLDNLDIIVNKIKSNSMLEKNNQGNNLENILKLNNNDKIDLDNKLNTIGKFNQILDNLITNKPEPNTLKPTLIKYTHYDNYFTNKN